MNKKVIILIVLAVLILVGGYWLLWGRSTPSGDVIYKENPANSGTVLVQIKGRAFVGSTVTILAGTTIIWKNYDTVLHSVVGQNFQSGPLKTGESYSHKFTQPGIYAYYDGIQPDTKGQIVVK